MSRMSANRVVKLGEGDENRDQDKDFQAWTKNFWETMEQSEKTIRDHMRGNTVNDVDYSDEEDANESKGEPLVSKNQSIISKTQRISNFF